MRRRHDAVNESLKGEGIVVQEKVFEGVVGDWGFGWRDLRAGEEIPCRISHMRLGGEWVVEEEDMRKGEMVNEGVDWMEWG